VSNLPERRASSTHFIFFASDAFFEGYLELTVENKVYRYEEFIFKIGTYC
jgi:hypothetical protein